MLRQEYSPQVIVVVTLTRSIRVPRHSKSCESCGTRIVLSRVILKESSGTEIVLSHVVLKLLRDQSRWTGLESRILR
jgi:hypothetical protein